MLTTAAPSACRNVRSGAAVPVRNMQNHVLHCYRNVFKCPMCSVAVLVKKRQQHVEQEKGTMCVPGRVLLVVAGQVCAPFNVATSRVASPSRAALEAACKMDKLGILSNVRSPAWGQAARSPACSDTASPDLRACMPLLYVTARGSWWCDRRCLPMARTPTVR